MKTNKKSKINLLQKNGNTLKKKDNFSNKLTDKQKRCEFNKNSINENYYKNIKKTIDDIISNVHPDKIKKNVDLNKSPFVNILNFHKEELEKNINYFSEFMALSVNYIDSFPFNILSYFKKVFDSKKLIENLEFNVDLLSKNILFMENEKKSINFLGKDEKIFIHIEDHIRKLNRIKVKNEEMLLRLHEDNKKCNEKIINYLEIEYDNIQKFKKAELLQLQHTEKHLLSICNGFKDDPISDKHVAGYIEIIKELNKTINVINEKIKFYSLLQSDKSLISNAAKSLARNSLQVVLEWQNISKAQLDIIFSFIGYKLDPVKEMVKLGSIITEPDTFAYKNTQMQRVLAYWRKYPPEDESELNHVNDFINGYKETLQSLKDCGLVMPGDDAWMPRAYELLDQLKRQIKFWRDKIGKEINDDNIN